MSSQTELYLSILQRILQTKNKLELKNVLWKSVQEKGLVCTPSCGKNINICILNAPCNGFGDLIFALKLSGYLQTWYSAKVTIVTTLEKSLLSLGADPSYVIGLVSQNPNVKNLQCRRFSLLKLSREIPPQDLILVAPMQIDFDPNFSDVKKLLPFATPTNTFTFSEYNDSTRKKFDFHTGIGTNRDGIFLTEIKWANNDLTKLPRMTNPYAMVYVAESLFNVNGCISSFVNYIAKKYRKKYPNLDIIVPPWYQPDKKIQPARQFYGTISIIRSDKKTEVLYQDSKNSNQLTFRADIFPVPNDIMIVLMRNSLPDILLTGDQSISDALSCCSNKNIFYQIAPWKQDFGKKLAELLPNPHLSSPKTSCGSLNALGYTSNYKKFLQSWNFEKLGKPKLDAIVSSVYYVKTDPYIQAISELISTVPKLASVQKIVREILNKDSKIKKFLSLAV